MSSIPVLDMKGQSVGEKAIQEDFLNGKINRQAMKEAIVAFLTHQREGNASTKTRAEVSGSGRKPWKQKGTGRARSGERTSPVWRGGGTVFGPQPHEFHYRVNRKAASLARSSALRLSFKEGRVKIIKELKLNEPKTKSAAEILENLKVAGKTLVVVKNQDSNLKLAFRNLQGVRLMRPEDLNTYEILTHRNLVFSEEALDLLFQSWVKPEESLS
ncbi:MAG: 50S ribosomal protein L4 [Chlamydiae bacterium]|nr:50S ribosomal protein L4 [Chlamydiota bacterium]MBI3266282.1 50S ribosomal protein L4 [Chlamydiota bacterium]